MWGKVRKRDTTQIQWSDQLSNVQLFDCETGYAIITNLILITS